MLKCVNNVVYSIRILSDGTLENFEPTDIDFNYMRNLDKEALSKGITVYSKDELLTLIEDFSS